MRFGFVSEIHLVVRLGSFGRYRGGGFVLLIDEPIVFKVFFANRAFVLEHHHN